MQSNDDELIGLIRRLEKKINNDQQTRSKHVSNYLPAVHLYSLPVHVIM